MDIDDDDDRMPRRPRRRPLYGEPRLLAHIDQRKGFFAILRRLPEPDSEKVTLKEWTALSGVYRGLKSMVQPDLWSATWREAKEYRKGLRPENNTSELAKAFALYGRHRDFQRAKWARETGYNAERERRRRAKDPDGYRRRNTERKRRSRQAAKARSVTMTKTEVAS